MPADIEFDALILAGGESRRMGTDKSLLPFGASTLIEHIAAQLQPWARSIRVSTAHRERHSHLGLPLVCDPLPGRGPLMGIAAGLEASTCAWTLVVATDIPAPPLELIPQMWALRHEGPCVVPRSADGRLQPLFALYHRRLAAEFRARIEQGQRRVLDAIEASGAAILAADTVNIANLNDRNAYEQARMRANAPPADPS